jgi:hypothetical protein
VKIPIIEAHCLLRYDENEIQLFSYQLKAVSATAEQCQDHAHTSSSGSSWARYTLIYKLDGHMDKYIRFCAENMELTLTGAQQEMLPV